jgi:integrase
MMANELTDHDQGKRKVVRHVNAGLRKVCGCPRRQWTKCNHAWHFNFTWRNDLYRFSLERQVGRLVQVSKNGKSVWVRDRGTLGDPIMGKEGAKVEADRLRTAIRNGEIQQTTPEVAEPITAGAQTLKVVAENYLEHYTPSPKKCHSRANWVRDNKGRVAKLTAFTLKDGRSLGDSPIGIITTDVLQSFYESLWTNGRAASTRTHYVQLLTSLFKWATRNGYITANPMITPEPKDMKIQREKPAQRDRRLGEGEAEALLAVAEPWLKQWIIMALDCGCRAGELRTLQVRDINMGKRWITIRASNAKDRESRTIYMTSRVHGILEMARLDPTGHELPMDAYILGDGTGRMRKSITKPWDTCVLKAWGFKPQWKNGGLAPESRAQLQTIDLHFHDLRHEAGSLYHEAGVPLTEVQTFYGHASLTQTATYVNAKQYELLKSMKRVDETRNGGKPVANSTPESDGLDCHEEQETTAKPLVN